MPPSTVRQARSGRRRGRSTLTRTAFSAAILLALTLSACSSGTSVTGGDAIDTGLAPGAPVKLGVLTSLTGGYASTFTTVEAGVKARIAVANAAGGVNGHKIQYSMADDASTPQGANAAVQKLIKQKVFGVLAVSGVFGGAAEATRVATLPVAGTAFDGSAVWTDPSFTNLFSATGYVDPDLVATTYGDFFAARKATKLAVLGGGAAGSIGAALGAEESAVHAGLKRGYRNIKVTPGTTDVSDLVAGIKRSGSDAVFLPLPPTTAFAVVAGLKQAGLTMKSILVTSGYGGELLQSPTDVAAGQGVEFMSTPAPVELKTPATRAFAEAVTEHGNSRAASSFGTYMGWLTADLFIHGLQATGPIVTQDGFISALHSNAWSGGGLEDITDFASVRPVAGGLGPGNCTNVARLKGQKFVPISGAGPICGTIIPRLSTGIQAQ